MRGAILRRPRRSRLAAGLAGACVDSEARTQRTCSVYRKRINVYLFIPNGRGRFSTSALPQSGRSWPGRSVPICAPGTPDIFRASVIGYLNFATDLPNHGRVLLGDAIVWLMTYRRAEYVSLETGSLCEGAWVTHSLAVGCLESKLAGDCLAKVSCPVMRATLMGCCTDQVADCGPEVAERLPGQDQQEQKSFVVLQT